MPASSSSALSPFTGKSSAAGSAQPSSPARDGQGIVKIIDDNQSRNIVSLETRQEGLHRPVFRARSCANRNRQQNNLNNQRGCQR